MGTQGCANGNVAGDRCTDTSVLDDDDFTYGTPSATYTITELGLADISNADNKFFLRFSGLTGTAAKTALAGLTLNADGNAFIINDGTASGNLLTWTTNLAWTSSTGSVQVSLAQSTTADAPAAPTNLGVAAGNAQLDLTWTAPSGTVTGYDVHYTSAASGTVTNSATASGNDPSTAWVAVTRTGATASQTISSLTNNTSYRVRVRAKNSAGNGEWVFGSGTPAAPTAGTPAAPTGLGVEPDDTQLGLKWTAPTGTLTGYDLHYTSSTTVSDTATASGSDASAAWVADSFPPDATDTSGTIFSLTNGTPYRVRLRAKNSTGAGAWAFTTGTPNLSLQWPVSTFSYDEDDTSGEQVRLSVSTVSGAVSGTLTYAAGTTNGASLSADLTTGYATTFSASANQYPLPTLATPVDDTVNEEHETFTVTINAGTGYVVGSPATLAVTITDNDPPAAPSGLSLTAGSGKLSASWTKPAGPVTGYELRHKQTTAANQTATTPGDPSTGWVTSTASITTTSAEITGLTNGTAYHVQVRATDGQTETGNGYGAWSASQSGTPVAVPPPAAPTNLSVSAGNTQLGLTWTAPSGTLTGYDVHYTSAVASSVSNSAAASGNDASAAWVAVSRGTENTPPTASQTISSLSNGTAYRVRVRAKNSVGNGAWVFGSGTPVAVAPAMDARLSALTVSSSTSATGTFTSVDLAQAFAASTTAYTGSVDGTRTHAKITPTAQQSGAAITVRRKGTSGAAVTSGSASGALPLTGGANVFEVVVTSTGGTATETYTVTVTRAATFAPFLNASAREGRSVGLTVQLSAPAPDGGLAITLTPVFGSALPTASVTVGSQTTTQSICSGADGNFLADSNDVGAGAPTTLTVAAGQTSASVAFPWPRTAWWTRTSASRSGTPPRPGAGRRRPRPSPKTTTRNTPRSAPRPTRPASPSAIRRRRRPATT